MKFRDASDIPEDDRIRLIVRHFAPGLQVAVCVDDEPEKVARYKAKIAELCPKAVIVYEGRGPTIGAYTIKYVLPADPPSMRIQ